MKNIEEKEKFIELRAKGFSFEKISKEINVSKPTLIKWQNEFRKEISNREFLNYQNIIEKHQLLKTNKVEILTDFPACLLPGRPAVGRLEKLWKEIQQKDLTTVGIKDLIRIKNDVATELNFETHDVKYQTGEYEENEEKVYDNVDELTIDL